jgi:hypothetical protein
MCGYHVSVAVTLRLHTLRTATSEQHPWAPATAVHASAAQPKDRRGPHLPGPGRDGLFLQRLCQAIRQ